MTKGCIGASDGWLVRVECPSLRDFVRSTGVCFSRKGLHVLDAQAITDHEKRVSFASVAHVGSAHDYACFKGTKSHEKLRQMENYSADFFFVFLELNVLITFIFSCSAW